VKGAGRKAKKDKEAQGEWEFKEHLRFVMGLQLIQWVNGETG